MYNQPVYAETSPEELYQSIRDNPLGILTTAIPSDLYPLLQSTHIPWILDPPNQGNGTTKARLRGHIARQNPQSKSIIDSLTASNSPSGAPLSQEVMILFTSPHHHYVTPKFYTETKPVTGKVAPTWNYSTVQVYGTLTAYFDPEVKETREFLDQQLRDLSDHCERDIMGFTGEDGREEAWRVDEAPEGYLRVLKRNIVGLSVEVERIEGKVKMSQERKRGDREGVVEGLARLGTDTAKEIARLVKVRGDMRDGHGVGG
ncbi:transcriptional regulator PAI 2-type [Aspergillus pseudocaelatus]|uniref:Transcriptional regulator PAI 2-type n=1 Tax=Aspergillus pseudocaelatus TaxID=1825620 RepID=A0ABQ6WT46_9EURO|nr:transcriptional regulator PAI 2-type [Aspergillus pseudocaelatus]